MATIEEVKKLAALARVTIGDKDLEKFASEFDAILAYVGQLEGLELAQGEVAKPALRNVMRSDDRPHIPGMYTEKIAEQFPARSGDALLVKQIISHE